MRAAGAPPSRACPDSSKLEHLVRRGRLRCQDTYLAARQFMGLVQEFLVWPRVMAFGEETAVQPAAEVVIEEAVLSSLYFDPEGPGPGRGRAPRDEHERIRWEGSKLVFDDSIAPVHRAGQAVLWEDTHRIDGNLPLEAAPGHTPGSSVLTLRSGTDRAVFVGDMLHSPVQVLEPAWNSCFCDDSRLAARTRASYLSRAAEQRELVIPAHWPGHGAAEVRRDGDGFAIADWAAFPRG
ncbi:TetR/AcrR family transcriptional regulator C-terminal domain-containing protein [Streptomyces spiralis]|nr:TetR/AcrR family transcriptional regulator C-terminal domain-containing protein [Streptomyces spiralis]